MLCNFLRHSLTASVIFFLLAVFATDLCAQQWAENMFKVKNFDFGNVSRNAKAEYEFEVYNPYVEDIHIRSVSASCSCTTVSVDKSTIKTYETAKVKAHYNTDRFTGAKNATLTVVIDKPFYATVQLQVKGNIRSDINFQPGEVNLGSVFSGQGVEKSVDFTYQGRSDWQVVALKSTNQEISAEMTEISRKYGQVRYRLKIKLAPNAPVGYINDRIILISNEGYQHEIPIMVQGVIKQGVTVNPSKLFVGNLESGQEITKKIVLRAESPFTIKEVTCPNSQYSFDFQQSQSTVGPRNIQIVTVSYKAPESTTEQQFTDIIHIKIDAQKTPIEIETFAKVVSGTDIPESQSEIAIPADTNQGDIADDVGFLSRFDP